MRARAGDPPRNMTQKVLEGHTDEAVLGRELVAARVDQVVVAREPLRALGAVGRGLKQPAVETAVVYDTNCITGHCAAQEAAASSVLREALSWGMQLAKPGIGFPAPVHLERFSSPGRIAVTDEPRLAAVGGVGLLALVVSPAQLADALRTGVVTLRPPRTVQILLTGRLRPFVCVRDVALEVKRRGLADIVRRIDEEARAPVVLEFAGPSARLLSVPERAVLCALAPQLGAAAALFASDEKSEVFLRDQRRSKAHRALAPDAGAPCDDVISIDLSAVDPLLLDPTGTVRLARELTDEPVSQVILGGDSGASLRDLLSAAALLKSKRVPAGTELLVLPPSRQALEVLALSGALIDLIATGARILEPDQRILTGELYPPPRDGLSLRTFDPEPGAARRFVVGSAETLAYALVHGKVGDPRSFKRPVRVTVPRALPTDDVLIVRKPKGRAEDGGAERVPTYRSEPWHRESTLALVSTRHPLDAPSALVADSLDEVRWAARHAASLAPLLRAVIAPHIPRGTVPLFADLGILALTGDERALAQLRGKARLGLPSPERWNEGIRVSADDAEVTLSWLAVGAERDWTTAGGRPAEIAGE